MPRRVRFLSKHIGASPLALLVFLASCSGAAQGTQFADLEIGSSPVVAEQETLPAIMPGRSDFRASDPATVQLASGRVQFVEFFAYWCAVCKAMAPTVHGLEALYAADVNFVYLDRDDPATLSLQDQLGYIYQPHFFILDENGIVLFEWRGFADGEILQEAIVEAIN